ncbi:MAG: hypothetical protein ABIG43_05665 [Chloroflexota bacterium]
MSDSDEVKNILRNRINRTDDQLTGILKLAESVPALQNLKDNSEISLNIYNELPKDYAEEIAPGLLSQEREFDDILNQNNPAIPDISPMFVKAAEKSGGTVTPYIVSGSNLVMEYTNPAKPKPDWVSKVTKIIDEHSTKVQQSEYLPNRLNKINRNLGKMYKVANGSYVKCKNRIVTIDQSAMQLRDVLQQVWGGLAEMARNRNIDKNLNLQNLAFKKEGDRYNIACILANEVFPKLRLVGLLNDSHSLYSNLSATEFGKNPLNEDIDRLNEYYNQWLSLLDGISGIVL